MVLVNMTAKISNVSENSKPSANPGSLVNKSIKNKKKTFNVSKKLRNAVLASYRLEKKFISDLFKGLPESALSKLQDADHLEDAYIIESDEEVSSKKNSKKEQFQQKQNQAQTSRTTNREELEQRLHAKIAELGKERLDGQHSDKAIRRKKRKVKKLEENEAKKKKFTSQSNPNLGGNQQGKKSGGAKANASASTTTGGDTPVKTPLQKKPVKTTNGEIVYSKFDFISDGRTKNKNEEKSTSSSKPLSILKSVEKQESKIKKLQGQGKTSEAVTALEKQKWNNALQRAKGTKVRDDPTLLKKTIKKMDKVKKDKQKKWAERVDQVEKQKKQRQDKRQSNIQARKDEKTKRVKKLQRKRGRIA